MPFDPKLIREDDANFERGDLQLPDDLAHLAEQLGDDAARLAAIYPAPTPKVLAVSLQPTSRRHTWLTRSFAGTALAAGLVTISIWASNSYQPFGEHPHPAIVPAPTTNTFVVTPSAEPSIPVTPASFLGDTSGPELEALMDLWEQDQPAVRSLSF